MNEQQLAHRFRSAVEAEPPLGFDPDDVIDRAVLRQRHGRRMLASAGAAGVLLVTSVITTTVLSNQRTVDAGTAVDTVLTASQKPTGTPSKWPGFPGSDQIVQRLQRIVPMVVAEHAPGVKLG